MLTYHLCLIYTEMIMAHFKCFCIVKRGKGCHTLYGTVGSMRLSYYLYLLSYTDRLLLLLG